MTDQRHREKNSMKSESMSRRGLSMSCCGRPPLLFPTKPIDVVFQTKPRALSPLRSRSLLPSSPTAADILYSGIPKPKAPKPNLPGVRDPETLLSAGGRNTAIKLQSPPKPSTLKPKPSGSRELRGDLVWEPPEPAEPRSHTGIERRLDTDESLRVRVQDRRI